MTDVIRPLSMQQPLAADQPLDFLLPSAHALYPSHPRRAPPLRAGFLAGSGLRPLLHPLDSHNVPSLNELALSRMEIAGPQLDGQRQTLHPSDGARSTSAVGYSAASTQIPRPTFNVPRTMAAQLPGGGMGASQADQARRDISPLNPDDDTPSTVVHRRRSSASDAIVPSLQIPASINDSKGSLAEFAAQITCLFWFESASVLHEVSEGDGTQAHRAMLIPEAMPTTGFRKWATTILSTTQVTQNVILLALLFIYRLKMLNPTVKGKPGSEFRLLTVALMLGNKFLDDNTYTNKTWAEVSGISVQEIHIMEVEFLSNMRYSLFTSEAEWKDWHVKLGRFWNYFEQASRTPVDKPQRRYDSPTAPLPTPPPSSHTSPPYLDHLSPNPLRYPHATAAMSHLAPLRPPPAARMPGLGVGSATRKRSYEESQYEPPAKRPARTGAASSGIFPRSIFVAPSYQAGATTTVPRLPAPQPSAAVSQASREYTNPAAGQFPFPTGRASSFIHHSQPPMAQSHMSLAPAMLAQLQTATHNPSPYEQPRRHSSHAVASLSSPASASYPVSANSRYSTSPSVILTNRNSPYRPVREVSTLLVPPQSAVTRGPPQNFPLNQMHYQPLGKARNEYKTGVVPYMANDTWSSFQQFPQWSQPPRPS